MRVHKKLQKKGDIHITIWYDSRYNKYEWVVAISGRDVQFVSMMNHMFNGKVKGSHWINMQNIGKQVISNKRVVIIGIYELESLRRTQQC